MKHLRILCLGLAVLALTACHQAPTSSASTAAVASVNGVPITQQFYDSYIKMMAGGRTAADLTPSQRAAVLNILIRAEAVAQHAEKIGLTQEPHTQAMLELARLNILEQALSDHFLAKRTPTEAQLQADYNQQLAHFPKLEYHARHILVKTKAQAEKIIQDLDRDHGRNFAALARAYSIDPSKANGGNLGWFPLSGMVPHFSAAIAKLKVGQITQTPVHTRYGWHVIQLLGTRPMKAPSFAEVKTKLKQDVENKQFLAYADSLTKAAKVETYLDPKTNKLTSGVAGAPAMPAPSAPAGGTPPATGG